MFQEKYKSTKGSINMRWFQYKRNKKLLKKLRRIIFERTLPLKLRMHVKEFSFIRNDIHEGKKNFLLEGW